MKHFNGAYAKSILVEVAVAHNGHSSWPGRRGSWNHEYAGMRIVGTFEYQGVRRQYYLAWFRNLNSRRVEDKIALASELFLTPFVGKKVKDLWGDPSLQSAINRFSDEYCRPQED